jgi:hypothetical protein
MRQTYVSIILFTLAGCGGNHTIGSTEQRTQSTGAACGNTTCPVGSECCNASCGICVAPGGACTQQLCDPPPATTTCGSTTCPQGTECCNASCGICVAPGEACTQQECDAPPPPSTCPPPDAPAGDPGALCADRRGGALITLGNPHGSLDGPDQIVLWITDSNFIDEAIQHQANSDWRVAGFDQVIAGTDCDPTHPWHVDPARATWNDTATEVCDATVTYITANLGTWGPNWCPWGGVVIAVDDRR